ncbi:MAG: transporter substrate-binding domain-containing protein [Pseudomonadota bacterium]
MNSHGQSPKTNETPLEQKNKPIDKKGWKETELRIVTDSDYPPFHYYDEEGILTGFNIDLARAICLELDVKCIIETRSWKDLIPAVNRKEFDAIIASIAIHQDTLKQVDFTKRYFQLPARFVARVDDKFSNTYPETLNGYTIGVVKNTAHEAFLRDFFSRSNITAYKKPTELYQDLQTKKIDLLFGDSVTLMFWLNGINSEGCCRFVGGPYTEARYFGEGVGIAVAKGNQKMRNILDQALDKVRTTGRYEELILRYFPLRFY